MALSKNKRSQILSLQRKKGRESLSRFLVEGHKSINDFIEGGWTMQTLLVTENSSLADQGEVIDESELRAISALEQPSDALAVFSQQTLTPQQGGLVLVLDRIQDPGNAGTLIRLADWYGLDYVAFSKGSVDPFNPKVVQSSMGAMARMPVVLMPEEALSQQLTAEGRTLFLADMGGKPVEQMPWPERSALVMGNEGAGPSEHWKTVTNQVVSIRRAKGRQTESLNVAMAGGILMQAWHIA